MSDIERQHRRRFTEYIIPRTSLAISPLPSKWTFVLIIPLVLIAFACFPPIRDWLYPTIFSSYRRQWYARNKSNITSWTEFVRIISEVMVAIFVGGQVFNESVRASAKNMLQRIQDSIDAHYVKQTESLKTRLREIEDELAVWLFTKFTFKNFFKRTIRAFGLINEMRYMLIHDVKNLYLKIFFVRFYYIFPSGLYGLLAYLFFLSVLSMKVIKYYLDFGSIN